MAEDGRVRVSRPAVILASPVETSQFEASRSAVGAPTLWTQTDVRGVANRLAQAAVMLRQEAFYPLVAHLFVVTGHPAWRPARGDTSNRIDLILVDQSDSLPVEVKSRTESVSINVKSVQQALENRVILDQRAFFPADPASSSLVVGFDYPPTRSDVSELIEDIAAAFGVNVGLVSLSDLYRLALEKQLLGKDVPRMRLSRLRGRLQ
jgi:hypothetical protein